VPGSFGKLGPEGPPEKNITFGKKEELWLLTATTDLISERSDGRAEFTLQIYAKYSILKNLQSHYTGCQLSESIGRRKC